jgi:hypothetical protein
MEFENFKPAYRKGSEELERAVNFAHQIVKEHPRFAAFYNGGRNTRAVIRGVILSKTSDNQHDWKEYFRQWVKGDLGGNYLLEFIDADGNPIPYTPKTPEQLQQEYEKRARIINSIKSGRLYETNQSISIPNHPTT